MQWQVPLQGGCLRRRWKNSTYFLREAGLWICLRSLVSGSHSLRCSYISPWLLMEEFHTPAARRENLDIISTNPSFSAGVSFHRNAWLDSGYMSCVCSRMLLDVSPTFYVKVYLDPEADSCPALRCAVDASVAFSPVVNSYPEVDSCPAFRRVWRVCTVDASVVCPSWLHVEIWTLWP